MKSPPDSPFSMRYSPNVPELMSRLRCTLVFSTYQAGKLIFLSALDEERLIQLPRTFHKPMGFGFTDDGNKLALATAEEVIVFANSPQLAAHYPKAPGKYDALYIPRITYNTGALDIHDLHWGSNGALFGVNTLFSCVCTFDSDYNFTPYWKPPQISNYASEDRCHLNGLAMSEGVPKYATAFNRGNTAQSWREDITNSGVVWDLDSSDVLTEGFGMPHSPKVYDGALYVLASATGELIRIHLQTGSRDTLFKTEAFLRGMTRVGDYLFIAHSKLRKNSSTFAKLSISEKANTSGVFILHLPTASLQGEIKYTSSVDEIYEIHAITNARRPNIVNNLNTDHKTSVMIPGATYWAKPNVHE